MGCCGSKEGKNTVSPEPEKKTPGVKATGRKNKGGKAKEREPLKREEMHWRRKKEEKTPEPPKEIEIVGRTSLDGHTQNVDLCGWHPSKAILLTAGTDRRVFLWDFRKDPADPLRTELELSISDAASCFHWAEGGGRKSTLAIGTERGYVYLWSEEGEKLDFWQPHDKAVAAVKQNGEFVLSAGDVVVIYNVKERSWFIAAWVESDLTDAEWIGGNRYLVADVLGVITMDKLQETQFMPINLPYEPPVDIPQHQFRSHFGGVYKVRAHPRRSKVFASCSVDNTVKVWSVDRTAPGRTLDEHFGYVLDVQWAGEDGELLASGSYDGTVRVWDPETGECLHSLEEHQDKVAAISLTRDGRYLASAGHDGFVHLWATDLGELVNSHEGLGRMMKAEFSRHSPELLATTSYGAVEVLRLQFNKRTEKKRREEEVEDFEEPNYLIKGREEEKESSRRRDRDRDGDRRHNNRRKDEKDGRWRHRIEEGEEDEEERDRRRRDRRLEEEERDRRRDGRRHRHDDDSDKDDDTRDRRDDKGRRRERRR